MHASVERKPKAQLLQRLHLLMQVQRPSPHGKAGLLPPSCFEPRVTVSELGERAVLARIQATLSATARLAAGLVLGIGDDAAIVAPTRNAHMVLTTDAQVEGVHFDRRFSTPADIGYRALAVNLSDLAAMGAAPRWALLSLALPRRSPRRGRRGLVAGVGRLAEQHRDGGRRREPDAQPGPLVVDITAVGEVAPRRALTRSGGRPGDELYVSGSIGGAAAGLEMLRANPEAVSEPGPEAGAECVRRYRRPEARVRLGVALARGRAARAAMDLSDGLADAAHQLAEASGCGVEIEADALPIEPAARAWWEAAGKDAVAARAERRRRLRAARRGAAHLGRTSQARAVARRRTGADAYRHG